MAGIRKLNPRLIDDDTCQRSLNWLRAELTHWFAEHVPGHGEIWFADDDATGLSSSFPNHSGKIEIIFTGSFFLRFLESELWPFENYRIWVLSKRVKDIFTRTFGVPASQVGVIGRPVHELVSPGHSFVYAGRLSWGKNIAGLLRFVSVLQKERPEVTIDLFGSFDDLPDESLGRFALGSLKDEISSLVKSLSWSRPPVFHGDVPQDHWPLLKRASPTFISFSSSMYEDYGTAAEIAARQGWPCLISDWGGHAEASAWHIPSHEIPQWFEAPAIQTLKAENLCRRFLKKDFSFRAENLSYIPEPCTKLADSRQSFLGKSGPETYLCLRHKMHVYADTQKGAAFFREYRSCMSGDSSGKTLLVWNDLSEYDLVLPADLGPALEAITLREVLSQAAVKRLAAYERIHVCTLRGEGEKLIDYFKNILKLSAEITLWAK